MNSSIQKEWSFFSLKEKLFVSFCFILGFLIAAEYGVTRPASQSLFLSVFSPEMIPWVWLATVPLNLWIVSLYNRFLVQIGPLKTLQLLCLATICINFFSFAILSVFPEWIFFQYAWKDVYILLMFKQLWSMIHSTIPSSKAKYIYGVIFGMGTLGSIVASQIPAHLAPLWGSKSLYLFTLPCYLLIAFFYKKAFAQSSLLEAPIPHESKSPKEGFALIRKNSFLRSILFLVILMQASVGFIEYQFNTHLALQIPELDLRTAYCGKLIGWMNVLSGLFQIIGGFLMIHTLGLRKSHLAVPLLLLLSAFASWMIPSFALLSFSYLFLKAIDFSVFGVIREMLYIPLKMDEKFRAKAIIDVFAHRSSKALVSFLILGLQWLIGAQFLSIAPYISMGIFLVWMLFIFSLFKAPLLDQKQGIGDV